jgi:hypothetical protein
MRAKFVFEFEKHDNPLKSLDVGNSSEYLKEKQLKDIAEVYNDHDSDVDKLIKDFADKYGRKPDILNDYEVKQMFRSPKYFVEFKLKLVKFTETSEETERNENYNLFVFLGYDKFIETKNGNYKKIHTFENLVYIDRYSHNDISQIHFMKMRVHTYDTPSNAKIYGVNIPKFMLDGDKNYYPEELKNDKKLLTYIEENKFKI